MAGRADIARDLSLQSLVDDDCRLAVEACPIGLVMTDSAGRIALANPEIERLFGYPPRELTGEKIEILLAPRSREAHVRHRAAFARHPAPGDAGEKRHLVGRRRDGSEFPVEIGLYPVRNGECARVLAIIADLGQRMRADRLKDEFVSTVSHELRTPLTSIAGSLGLLVGGAAGILPEPAARLIRIAQSNSQRLVRLINDILDIEKIESGQLCFKFKRLKVRALIEQVIEASRGYADGFHVRVQLAADAASAEVYADPDRLAQVITNLLSNAIKFSPAGGQVTVTISEGDETVRVAVRDHGPGIPHDFRPRIFEKFAQADASDARQKGGSGLGLSIVKQIVARLGGTVGFEDAAGGGTVFYVELANWTRIAAREIDTEPSAHAPRILLCEDNLDAALALRDGLRPFGWSTDFALCPADATARARATRYHAIVVDLELADDCGIELIRSLRAQPQLYKTPIVAVSADDDYGGRALETRRLSVLECVPKPIDVDRLAQILERAIVRDGNHRPLILHVDDDPGMLELVATALHSTANVISFDSLEAARCALLLHNVDLAILDISLGAVSGLELLPDLRRRGGVPIPVIVFSAHGAQLKDGPPVEASLDKSSTASLQQLVAAVRDRLMLAAERAPLEAMRA